MTQAGIDPPGQSHASYEVSALPPSRGPRLCVTIYYPNFKQDYLLSIVPFLMILLPN